MHMISFAYLAGSNGKALFIGNGINKLIKSVTNLWSEHFFSVLHTPHDMIIDVVYAGSCVNIFIFHTDSISHIGVKARIFQQELCIHILEV